MKESRTDSHNSGLRSLVFLGDNRHVSPRRSLLRGPTFLVVASVQASERREKDREREREGEIKYERARRRVRSERDGRGR